MSQQTGTDHSIIHPLPPQVSNKIAAGEVIQRPSSVVKELLDNAIDAGADQIKIIIQNAGRTLMQVIDNGSGMGQQDVRLCFQQHATSKIQQVEDLFRVRTLGFRGEAMASIASIAQVELQTKRQSDESGIAYKIWGGEEKKIEPAGVENGTSVAVKNLFYNVPARRQFLKTDATEFRHILNAVQQAALAHPDIGFHLVADTDDIYELPPDQPMQERVADIFGNDYRASLITVAEETSYVNIRAVLSDPKLTKRSRGEQFLFVNGRPFKHRYLIHSVLNVYETWIGEKDYPFFALFINLDPTEVDVNVHPAKEEVKFEDERSIIKLTKSVIRKALNERFMVPEVPDDDRVAAKGDFSRGFSFPTSSDSGKSAQFPSRINFKSKPRSSGTQWAETIYGDESPGRDDESSPAPKAKRMQARGFWQLHNRYILTQTRSGLCMIDQHAAHKRIIYEQSLEATESALPSTQQLLFAQTVELSATEFAILEEVHPILLRMGFNIELLSGHTAMISGVPADIDIGNEQSVLKSMLHKYRELDARMELDARHKLAVAFAAKTAVPLGKKLADAEMENLIDQLFACSEPYRDPQNKSTIIYLSLEDIEARFR